MVNTETTPEQQAAALAIAAQKKAKAAPPHQRAKAVRRALALNKAILRYVST